MLFNKKINYLKIGIAISTFTEEKTDSKRYEIIDNVSLVKKNTNNKNLSHSFKFIKAKLFGYTEKNNYRLKEHLEGDYLDYARAIFISRKGKLKESLIILNKLIRKYPKNFFLKETKADLLLSHGFTNEANEFYKIVFNNNANNKYVKKRIFEIEYEKNFKNEILINEIFFNDFVDLIFTFPKDILLQKKFIKIANFLKKHNWMNFIEANILMINGKNDIAMIKLRNILNNSNDKDLIKFTRKKIRLITNE